MTRAKISLGLLPSGPDPVGEWYVHANLPSALYQQQWGTWQEAMKSLFKKTREQRAMDMLIQLPLSTRTIS